jgi:hypothetical protein
MRFVIQIEKIINLRQINVVKSFVHKSLSGYMPGMAVFIDLSWVRVIYFEIFGDRRNLILNVHNYYVFVKRSRLKILIRSYHLKYIFKTPSVIFYAPFERFTVNLELKYDCGCLLFNARKKLRKVVHFVTILAWSSSKTLLAD